MKNLNPENFPDLISKTIEKQHNLEPIMNYSDKLKSATIKKGNIPKNLEVEVDLEYESLNLELTQAGPTEETITALVDNLKMRLELLMKLKTKLKELKNNTNENISSIEV